MKIHRLLLAQLSQATQPSKVLIVYTDSKVKPAELR
jgi:hypothetical protein